MPSVLLVHAHPDDEVTTTGLTMARAAAAGAQVTLVTCTLGEEGDIVTEDLAHVRDAEGGLAAYRISELDAAMQCLGITDYVRLGHDGKYRDSGMAVDEAGRPIPPETLDPEAFWLADLREAATDLVAVIRDRRPDVLITYDDYGNYGHPDHIQANRVAMYATQLAAVPSYRADLGEAWQTRRLLWSTFGESAFRTMLRLMRDQGQAAGHWSRFDPEGRMPPMVCPDADIAVTVTAPEYIDQKLDAFRAHASQIPVDSPFFAMAAAAGVAWGQEWFRFAGGTPVPAGATDIFDGL